MKQNLSRNIPLLLIIQSLRWFLMIMPTIILFFQENGLSLFQVMIVQAAFSFTMVVFEIPSGYFSDKIGRKITMILGLFSSMTGMFLFAMAPGFFGFILAEIFLGIGGSFISGTDSSLLYDSLLLLKDAHKHHQKEGLFMSIANYSESAAAILGGFVAAYSMRMNFFIEGILLFLAIILALFLIEPEIDREGRQSLNISQFLIEIKDILKKRKVLYLVGFGALSGLGTFLPLWYIQPEMASRGLPVSYFGVLWAGLNVLVGISAGLSHRLPVKKDPLIALAWIPFILALSHFSLIFLPGYAILIGFILFYILRGLKNPFERNLIHREVTSGNRATVLSLKSLLMRISFTVTGPAFALLSREEGNHFVYLAMGLSFTALGIINLIAIKRMNYSLSAESRS